MGLEYLPTLAMNIYAKCSLDLLKFGRWKKFQKIFSQMVVQNGHYHPIG